MLNSYYEKKLRQYIDSSSIQAQQIIFEKSCHSVEEAAEAAGTEPANIVKSICMIGPENKLVVAIVMGTDKVSTKKVARALGISRPRMAKPQEILQLTGYPCGGTPSFGYEASFIVDPAVLERKEVYSGGGSEYSLTRVPTEEILRVTNALVAGVVK